MTPTDDPKSPEQSTMGDDPKAPTEAQAAEQAEESLSVNVQVTLRVPPRPKSVTDSAGKRHKLGELSEQAVATICNKWVEAFKAEAKRQRDAMAADDD